MLSRIYIPLQLVVLQWKVLRAGYLFVEIAYTIMNINHNGCMNFFTHFYWKKLYPIIPIIDVSCLVKIATKV
jgi:hypothetical protein